MALGEGRRSRVLCVWCGESPEVFHLRPAEIIKKTKSVALSARLRCNAPARAYVCARAAGGAGRQHSPFPSAVSAGTPPRQAGAAEPRPPSPPRPRPPRSRPSAGRARQAGVVKLPARIGARTRVCTGRQAKPAVNVS